MMAVFQLEKENYINSAYIFQPLADFQPLCAAVIAGLQTGKIFVDREDDPQAAFMTVWDNWGFLAGNPTPAFVTDLNMALLNRTLVEEQVEYLILTIEEEKWEEHLAPLFQPRHPIPVKRRHYTSSHIGYDWRRNIPEGFEIKPITPELYQTPNLPDEVKETLDRWQRCNHPEFKDCGMVAMFQGEIAAWATVDAITANQGDIGLVTLEPFRRKGLAAATGGAVAEQAFDRGVDTIQWTCMDGNPGSIRTAEKLGFAFQNYYHVYFFEFDELWDLIQYAGYLINQEEYSAGLAQCEKALAGTDTPPPGLLIHTARAQAMCGLQEQALDTLDRLVRDGWQDLAFLENDRRLVSLKRAERWQGMTAKLHAK